MADAFIPSLDVASLRESAMIAVSARARELRAQGRAVIDLGAGEPDADTPQFVCEAAADAVAKGATRYTAVEGLPGRREAAMAIVPGAAFGTPEWVRISFAAPTGAVIEGVRRTADLLREWA